MEKEEPKTKYDFHTGKTIKKVKKVGYKYLGRGEIGELKSEIIDKERFYYVSFHFGRSSLSRDKNKFKKIEYWEEDTDWETHWVKKQKPKNKLVFDTKIEKPKERLLSCIQMKLGKDYIHFFTINESNIIRDLQLKEGDKVKVTIEKQEKK